MCRIAGIVDLTSTRNVERPLVHRMAKSLIHRGPDQDGFYFERGVGLASRRLSIVGIADGQQPVQNEDQTVTAVYNGECFDHVEVREKLIKQGHRFKTSTDSEILVHLWEEYGEDFVDSIGGNTNTVVLNLNMDRLSVGI